MRCSLWACGVVLLLPWTAHTKPTPLDVEPEDLRPGLIAHYQSLENRDAGLVRLEPRASFSLGLSSPHPRLPPGPFEVTWTGVLNLNDPPVTFEAALCGELTVEIAGVVVLKGRGDRETSGIGPGERFRGEPGSYRLKIHYRSLANSPARLQLWWAGDSFAREPIPAWVLKHLSSQATPTLAQEQLALKGRRTAELLGCARCHNGALPGITAPPPGPSLADVGTRVSRAWLLDWLEEPSRMRVGARMPALFASDRAGFVERWLIADYLAAGAPVEKKPGKEGDHRMGRRHFVSAGCAACHLLPDADRKQEPLLDRTPLVGLRERLPQDELAAFLGNPHTRYPDGRMPRIPVTPDAARDIASYLLLWSGPSPKPSENQAPTQEEIQAVGRRLGARGVKDTATALLREKRCAECHPGVGPGIPANIPVKAEGHERGCLSGKSLPRFALEGDTRQALKAYLGLASGERHPSPFESRQRLVDHLGCVRCHQRNSDRPPPLEAIGSTLGGAWLQNVPYQRTPRLSDPLQKYSRSHLVKAIREGVHGLRAPRYSYRMPAFGREAESIVQALAEADGELFDAPEPPEPRQADATLGPLAGPTLAGFQGYGCVSCHLWDGKTLSSPDPGAIGTDLTRVSGRIRREWFDRFLENPMRFHPGTPMPAIFEKGQPAKLKSILDGDAARQKDALWSYFALGNKAPSPRPPPPMPLEAPGRGEPALVAQIPVRLPDNTLVESLSLLFGTHDLLVYDLGTMTLHSAFTGAQLLRGVQGRLRTFSVSGMPLGGTLKADPPLQMIGPGGTEKPSALQLHGHDRLADGATIRYQVRFSSTAVEAVDTIRLEGRRLLREVSFSGVPARHSLEIRIRIPEGGEFDIHPRTGQARGTAKDGILSVVLVPSEGTAKALIRQPLPAAKAPPAHEAITLTDTGKTGGSLERPGYRAIAYPRPKTLSGEDRVMPGAIAVDPRDGRVFVASMKTGEILVVRDPDGDGKKARFENYTRGLFQECYSMLADREGLYVLHRRNLTRIRDTDGDGLADRFDRVAGLPHGVAETYDYAYGLARDRTGAFLYSFAPYANTHLPGSGGALRLVPGKEPREVGFGFRNPLGWCAGPDGEIFFTDNQGEWVATNKLGHLVAGGFHGFPNPAQKEHAKKPFARPAVWVPYDWARSINGIAHDSTQGEFGPFAGQLFLAELMFGGGILRASVEKVNGVYQGACFPFWGQGLLGPVTLAFDPRGRLWVGSITEPGWMAQPDRGALYRIDFTGKTPFEMKTIHVLPRGFRIVFTAPVSETAARDLASYRIDHHRYEYSGAYGSPELDRSRLTIERVELAADRRSVELTTAPLIRDRVYLIQASGVRSSRGEPLVHPTGAYTLNEIPALKP